MTKEQKQLLKDIKGLKLEKVSGFSEGEIDFFNSLFERTKKHIIFMLKEKYEKDTI